MRNLPAYCQGSSSNYRKLKISVDYGYFLYEPFVLLGP
ncbi:MAG: photosystem I reaction center subunit XI [cyanobacterium endosymbiont of Rhopalodia sterrenbergii]